MKGWFAHINMGWQNWIPHEVYRQLKITIPDIPDLNQLEWRYLYKARIAAAEGYKADIPKNEWKTNLLERVPAIQFFPIVKRARVLVNLFSM